MVSLLKEKHAVAFLRGVQGYKRAYCTRSVYTYHISIWKFHKKCVSLDNS